MTLQEWISDCNYGRGISEFGDVVWKHRGDKIAREFRPDDKDFRVFPQQGNNYRNVHCWVLMEDGSAFGWNESPRRGWSFPRIGKKTVSKIMKG